MPRTLYVYDMLSLDGYFEGPQRDLRWHNVDAEFNALSLEMLGKASAFLFGRVTYDVMASHWTREDVQRDDPDVARMMNGTPKVVFSRTLGRAEWSGTTLARDAASHVAAMKAGPGGDLAILGSSALAASLLDAGLLDEVRVVVAPVALGRGRSFLDRLQNPAALTLLEARAFRSGNVLLRYAVKAPTQAVPSGA